MTRRTFSPVLLFRISSPRSSSPPSTCLHLRGEEEKEEEEEEEGRDRQIGTSLSPLDKGKRRKRFALRACWGVRKDPPIGSPSPLLHASHFRDLVPVFMGNRDLCSACCPPWLIESRPIIGYAKWTFFGVRFKSLATFFMIITHQ